VLKTVKIADVIDRKWDAVIVGSGLAGSFAALTLADAGQSVLIVEQARAPEGDDPPEVTQLMADIALDGSRSELLPTTISATGGTSVVYAAALERPERHDMDDLPGCPHPTGGWPVGFDSFAPYYVKAESMLRVCGDADPLGEGDYDHLAPPPKLSPGDDSLMGALRAQKLNPYRTHVAIGYDTACRECIGTICLRACKGEARNAALVPALATGRAALLDSCIAVGLLATDKRVTGVEVLCNGERKVLHGRRILLAGGALATAQLLLDSRSAAWPKGLANRSGLVGRNVMFHLSERFAIWPPDRGTLGKPAKSLALRDIYKVGEDRFGVVQSMGLSANYGNVLMHLYDRFDRGPLRAVRPLRPLLRIPAKATALALGKARVFVGILEDPPSEGNRIVPQATPGMRPRIEYRLSAEFQQRRARYRAAISAALRGQRWFFLNQRPEINFPHACGTARFGSDPRRSVLNPDCRAHDLRNLYVLDASFMPTATGVNPGLTIAANSLRVAERMLAE